MKRFILAALLLTGSIASQNANAQVRVNVNFNIGSQPEWGPAGYDYAEYYYLPDIEAYYNVPARRFIYAEGGRWITAASLPVRYRGFDLYHSYKVVINAPKPYLHHNVYRTRYAGYRGRPGQMIIRNNHYNNHGYAHDNHGNHHDNRNRNNNRGWGHGR
ncbi:MAG TPA: hypothetical protein VFS25_22305 [Chitinophaga sp.]|uniref:hypothetical protein n=1 Tax=Chitinophaga sp. TaxID=1869181 RepID=UPI002DB9CB58|nr:hypothetical protein [Chitinophaga sp.]HEU4555595.1 hypothetical protein [Chitinophaga sp.]